MFYLLFEFKNEQKGRDWREFFTKDELIRFLLDNSKSIKSHKIVESETIYEFRLIKVDRTCKKCGKELSEGSLTGYCKDCSSGSRLEASTRKCSECGRRIADWNKSGLCPRCRQRRDSKKNIAKRKEKRAVEKLLDSKKEPKMGKCAKCKKEFELEDWQHSSLHWCPDCRKLPDYKNFNP